MPFSSKRWTLTFVRFLRSSRKSKKICNKQRMSNLYAGQNWILQCSSFCPIQLEVNCSVSLPYHWTWKVNVSTFFLLVGPQIKPQRRKQQRRIIGISWWHRELSDHMNSRVCPRPICQLTRLENISCCSSSLNSLHQSWTSFRRRKKSVRLLKKIMSGN